MCATVNGRFQATRALLNHNADVNTQADDGQTPLIFTAWQARMPCADELVGDLLRFGADETMVDGEGKTAADHAGRFPMRMPYDIEENVDRVIKLLLANAPADRAWRRRGLLLLCVARRRRERLQSTRINSVQIQSENGRPKVEEKADNDWTRMATWVAALGLGQEGVFRTVVGYL